MTHTTSENSDRTEDGAWSDDAAGTKDGARTRDAARTGDAAGTNDAARAESGQYVFDLDGGRHCLDFVNTRSSSGEHLNSYADLVAFAAQSHLLTPENASWLQAEAKRDPAAAEGVMARALRLREAMRGIFSTIAADKTPRSSDLGTLNLELAANLTHARVVPNDAAKGGFQWGWSGRNLDAPIWPITRSAADLLTSEQEQRLVRECGASDCEWLFMDETRNRSRQWCSMQACGNREKARRHYQRQRSLREAGAGAGAKTSAVAPTSTAAKRRRGS